MTARNDDRIGGLLLAAGGSRRLGKPKQLLELDRQTLIRTTASALADSGCEPCVAVLGAEAERCGNEIKDLAITAVENPMWENGMSSSIRVGLAKLIEIDPFIDAVMITLCDQPLVTSEKIALFSEKFTGGRPAMIAARYNGVLGVPALFSKEMFGDLLRLDGDKGARDLIREHRQTVAIDLPEAAIDIDTADEAQLAGLD